MGLCIVPVLGGSPFVAIPVPDPCRSLWLGRAPQKCEVGFELSEGESLQVIVRFLRRASQRLTRTFQMESVKRNESVRGKRVTRVKIIVSLTIRVIQLSWCMKLRHFNAMSMVCSGPLCEEHLSFLYSSSF